MTSFSIKLRNLLKSEFELKHAKIQKEFISKDGTIKYSFLLYDRNLIEGVLIPSRKRITACISSQVGCSLNCSFCATGVVYLRRQRRLRMLAMVPDKKPSDEQIV